MSLEHDAVPVEPIVIPDDDPETLDLADYRRRNRLSWTQELRRLERTYDALADFAYFATVEEVSERLMSRIERLRRDLQLIGPLGGVRRTSA